MKNTVLFLFLIVVLNSCVNQQSNHKNKVKKYYHAFDSGNFYEIKNVIHNNITIVSGDFKTPYNHDSFYEFYKWDSIFRPSYELLEIEEKNNDIIATITQNNIRNKFLQNNPLKLKVKVSFTSGKISKLEELEYINVNWDTWAQRRDSLVNWIQFNHSKLDGFVNDMTMTGALNYLKAMELYETQE